MNECNYTQIKMFKTYKNNGKMCVFYSILQDMKAKIQKMKVYEERLMESLGDILEQHVPLPQNESSTKKKKKVQ